MPGLINRTIIFVIIVFCTCLKSQGLSRPENIRSEQINLQEAADYPVDSMISGILYQINIDTVKSFIQGLQDFGTRYAYAPNRDSVANWVKYQFEKIGYTNVRLDSFYYDGTLQMNVEAALVSDVNSNTVIIVGGHHDSHSFKDPLISAPGADDNASGTAAVLELARVFKRSGYKPNATIKFVTFAAEEIGLKGSSHYAKSAKEKDTKIRLMMNHDMISNSPYSIPNSSVNVSVYYPDFTRIVKEALPRFSELTVKQVSRGGSSDHLSFIDEGYKALYFAESVFSPHYHSSKDILSNHNMLYCTEVIKISCAALLIIDQTPVEVSNVRVYDEGTGSSLLVTWESEVPDHIIRIGTESGKYDTVYQTSGRIHSVKGLSSGIKYFIGVSSYNPMGIEGPIKEVSFTPTSVPSVPEALTDMPERTRIDFVWKKNKELDITGYNVYRSKSDSESYEKLNTAPVKDTVYTDADIENGIYYYYQIKAIDSTGLESPAAATRSRLINLDSGILLVDETSDGDGSPLSPADSSYDNYFNDILEHFNKSVVDLSSGSIKLADIGAYSTIIWCGNDKNDISALFSLQNDLKKYLDLGGNFIYNGYFPCKAITGNKANIAQYDTGSFIHDYFKISTYESELAPRFYNAKSITSEYSSIFVDTTKTLETNDYHLTNIEVMTAAPGGNYIFMFESRYGPFSTEGYFNGRYVGVENQRDKSKTIILSFPLFYMKKDHAKEFIETSLLKFKEKTSPDYDPSTPAAFKLQQNYPNPFNSSTTIMYELPQASNVSIIIYDMLGKEVTTLFSGYKEPGRYNANFAGSHLASGVYCYQLKTDSQVFSKKMILLK